MQKPSAMNAQVNGNAGRKPDGSGFRRAAKIRSSFVRLGRKVAVAERPPEGERAEHQQKEGVAA